MFNHQGVGHRRLKGQQNRVWVEMKEQKKDQISLNVTIIGCGVAGLSTAILFQSLGHKVTIISKNFPGRDFSIDPMYVSKEAGAHWFSDATSNDFQRFEKETYDIMNNKFSIFPQSGIIKKEQHVYYEVPGRKHVPWFSKIVDGFRILEKSELPKEIEFGYCFMGLSINCMKYLNFLYDQFLIRGGQSKIIFLSRLFDCFGYGPVPDIIVNCSGLGARNLVGDLNVYAVRGQTILISVPQKHPILSKSLSLDHTFYPNEKTYLIPRDDGTVLLGGTFEVYNSNPIPHRITALKIFERCKKYSKEFKDLSDFKVLRDGVGLRPCRIGGPKIDVESIVGPNGNIVLLASNYGHGPSGYQSSWGSANRVVELCLKEYDILKSLSKI